MTLRQGFVLCGRRARLRTAFATRALIESSGNACTTNRSGRRRAHLRDLPAGRAGRRAFAVHAPGLARERRCATAGTRRSRRSPTGTRTRSRRRRSRSLLRACCSKTSPACPRSSTSPRCGTRSPSSAATRPDQPADPRRARDRPLGAGRQVRVAHWPSRTTSSSSSSATASGTRSCAGGSARSTNFKVVPPGTGICHQVNLEFLARVVEDRDGVAFPDTVVGTDSHTTMVNGLGVLGWGVGGIEAEAAMLGEPLSMPCRRSSGSSSRGSCAKARPPRTWC